LSQAPPQDATIIPPTRVSLSFRNGMASANQRVPHSDIASMQ